MTKRLLLIDDEETILFALDRYFSRNGFDVDCARELEVVGGADGERLRLLLTENGSTEGLEILRHIRQTSPAARFIPQGRALASHAATHVLPLGDIAAALLRRG